MRELVRTNNAVLITAIEALLKGAHIPHVVLDQHMSVLEGSLGILPRRILVDDEQQDAARRLLQDAGLAHELRPHSPGPASDLTDDAVLGGRLHLLQRRRGHRVGHDAILLAAATSARDGDHAVDLGAGVGAAGLALALRIPGVTVTLVESNRDLTALAAQNIARNGLERRVRVTNVDVTAAGEEFEAAGIALGTADCVLMNPPFHDTARHNVSPDPGRRAAHAGPPGTLAGWVEAATRLLHSAGTLTLIWRADGLADVLAALRERYGGTAVMPVHGRAGQPAVRILVGARKGSRAPLALLPGLALNDDRGQPTAEAEAVLRGGQSLSLLPP